MARKRAANKRTSVTYPPLLGMHELKQVLQSFARIAENEVLRSEEVLRSMGERKLTDYQGKRFLDCKKVLSLSSWLIGKLGKSNSELVSAALDVGLIVSGISSRDAESARAMYAQSQRSAAVAARRAEVERLYQTLSTDDRKKRETAAKRIHELFKIKYPEQKWTIYMFRRDLHDLGH